jgi:adenosylhomocysteine nucleosidase
MKQGSCTNITDQLVICLTGIGRNHTKIGVEQLVTQRVGLMISWGSAAGLFPGLKAGDLLIPESVKANQRVFQTAGKFNEKIISHLPGSVNLHRGPMVETRQILATMEDKKSLFESSGCRAADMESGALAELAGENNIPFSVIRSVSDPVELALPESLLNSFKDGAFQPLALLANSLPKPGDWISIAKLMTGFSKARKTLITAGEVVKMYSDKWM